MGHWNGWQSRRLLGGGQGTPGWWEIPREAEWTLILRRMEGVGTWAQSRLSLAEGCGEG